MEEDEEQGEGGEGCRSERRFSKQLQKCVWGKKQRVRLSSEYIRIEVGFTSGSGECCRPPDVSG